MTNFDTQTLIALLCVIVALAVLFRRAVFWLRGQSIDGCGGGCNGCGSAQAKLKVPLTVIQTENHETPE